MNRKLLGIIFTLVAAAISSQSLNKEWEMLSSSGVHENYEVRMKHQAVLYAKSFEAVTAPKRIFTQTESDINVRFEVRKTATAYYLMFLNQFQDRFPVWSSGSYIVKKDLVSGEFIQAKIFLFNNEDSFIRIYPEQNRSRLDLHLFGNIIYSGIRIPMGFKKLVILPLCKILSLTENKIPWDTILADHSYIEWRDIENFSYSIQNQLPQLGDNEDGAYNQNGELVFIETLKPQSDTPGLNCSGFVKWTVDNLYYELTGSYMPIEPLKKKHYDLRGNSWSNRAEDTRDPYFGLDWTRNIAFYYRSELYPYQENSPISQDINSVPYFQYKDNVGYAIEELKAVLYLDSINNPGKIYLGSVNKLFGKDFKMRQHIHVVALIPYIDRDGVFIVDVIERQTKTSIESLLRRYKGEFIHLVDIELN